MTNGLERLTEEMEAARSLEVCTRENVFLFKLFCCAEARAGQMTDFSIDCKF